MKKKHKKKHHFFLLNALFAFLVVSFVLLGTGAGIFYSYVKEVDAVDPHSILSELNLNSLILDENGNTIEKIHTEENRTIVKLEEVPLEVQNAFIAIEDERFLIHKGIDVKSLFGAILENLKARAVSRGASTITQQLARNVYLSNELTLERKAKEAYIAINLEQSLSKSEILEAYLNSIYFGQGAYGISEASQTYFGKPPIELSLAESAVIAGITNNPSKLPPYLLLKPENVKSTDIVLGETAVLGETFIAVFNPSSIERQQTILYKMNQLGYIDDSQYEKALSEDVASSLVVKRDREETEISSYFIDYVKDQVVKDLIDKAGYTEEKAERELLRGGIKVHSTVDLSLQKRVEDIYENFNGYISTSNLSSFTVDKNGNIVKSSENPEVIYYKKDNLLDKDENLVLNDSEFSLEPNGDISISSRKLFVYKDGLNIRDYYSKSARGELLTHELGNLSIPKTAFSVKEESIVFKKDFLNSAVGFHSLNEKNRLVINSSYFSHDAKGIVQPQSGAVVLDQSNGKIKALIGGRSWKGKKVFNRAVSPRQTGSAIKPLAVYLPALDSEFTPATPIDDVPKWDKAGNLWPKNYDSRYRGLTTLRESVELSINTNAVSALETLGIENSIKYLEKMGIIKLNEPDSFVTRYENPSSHDENLASLALGGFTEGISPLDMAGAYSSIANSGVYVKPMAYTKVEDRDGKIILDSEKSRTKVVSPEIAFLMTDILKLSVTRGMNVSRAAMITSGNRSIPVAGKTGTTNENTDAWFVGYTPYYTASVWIGNDSVSVKLKEDSKIASEIFSAVMKEAHKGLPAKEFEKPENIVEKQICNTSGKLVSALCLSDERNTVRTEYFARGKEPLSECQTHVSVDIDVSTGQLANRYCPAELVEKRVFIYRNKLDIEKYKGILPEDYKYAPPDKECSHTFSNTDSLSDDSLTGE